MDTDVRTTESCQGLLAALLIIQRAEATIDRPLLVGIGGPGGSGKSTFAQTLALQLGGASVLPLDDYRKPRAERQRWIYGSHPEGNRIDVLTGHLEAMRAGRAIDRPVFCRDRGAAHDSERLEPGRYVIADGEIAAHDSLRGCFDVRVLVLAGWAHQWRARMGRDRQQRSTSIGKALSLFFVSNLRDYPRFSAGAVEAADLVLMRSACGRHFHRHQS